MKRLLHIRPFLLAAAFFAMSLPLTTSCSDNNDEYNQLPPKIQAFISEYFPEISVSDYSFSDNVYHVTLSGSAYLEFNTTPAWTEIDGRGSILPGMLLYDQLPTTLYTYIETIGVTDGVYSLTRNNETIKAGLLDSTLTYDIATDKVHGPE